jgi:hypothetical protein
MTEELKAIKQHILLTAENLRVAYDNLNKLYSKIREVEMKQEVGE